MAKVTIDNGALGSTIRAALNAMFTELYQLLTGKAGGQTVVGGTLTTQRLELRGNAADLTSGGVDVLDTLDSADSTHGALAVAGGAAVAKKLNVGGAAAAASFAASGDVSGATLHIGTFQVAAPFVVTKKIQAAAAGTVVHLLLDTDVAAVGASAKAYLTGFRVIVDGATPWTDLTATKLLLQDTAANAFATIAKAGLVAHAALGPDSASVTLGEPFIRGSGSAAGKGLDIIGDANFAAGSDVWVTITGYIQ
jgi:hypothetical protein